MLTRSSRTFLIALLAATALFHIIAANAEARPNRESRTIPSWYINLGGAVSFVEESYFTVQGTGGGDGTLNLDTGYGLSGAIGYRPRYTNSVWDNIRVEFEIGLLDNEIDSLTNNATGTTTNYEDIQSSRVMANLYYDFDASKQFRPYVGAGLGMARIHAENDEDSVIAYQGMFGVSYIPSQFPITEFGAGYRYFSTNNPVFTVPGTGQPYEVEYDAHILELNMRAYF